MIESFGMSVECRQRAKENKTNSRIANNRKKYWNIVKLYCGLWPMWIVNLFGEKLET